MTNDELGGIWKEVFEVSLKLLDLSGGTANINGDPHEYGSFPIRDSLRPHAFTRWHLPYIAQCAAQKRNGRLLEPFKVRGVFAQGRRSP